MLESKGMGEFKSRQPAQGGDAAPGSDGKRIQLILRTGLVLSMVLMAAGMVLKLLSGHEDAGAVQVRQIFEGGIPVADRLMITGISILSLTPAFRVAALIVIWVRERDWRFVGVAVVVLIVLSIAIALGGG